eukprot:12803813-Alexandrium_andersonii.AAC.1
MLIHKCTNEKSLQHSELELRGPRSDLKLAPRRYRLGGSASFCALTPMVTTKQADGRAGGASWGA